MSTTKTENEVVETVSIEPDYNKLIKLFSSQAEMETDSLCRTLKGSDLSNLASLIIAVNIVAESMGSAGDVEKLRALLRDLRERAVKARDASNRDNDF